MHLTDAKEDLRAAIVERIKGMGDEKRHAEGRTVSRELLKLIPEGSTVCAYVPLKTEADIRLLLNALLERGDTLYLPCFEDNRLVYRKTDDLSTLKKGLLKISEPPLSAEQLDEQQEGVIVLVPGRAFDRQGNRLGRGAGGYDRWIQKRRSDNPSMQFWGVCFECQAVDEVPMEEWDQQVDQVITARGIL